MEYSDLYDLIKATEYGTKLHIGVIFLGSFGNEKCHLPFNHTVHPTSVCEHFKESPEGLKRCMRCRNVAIKIASGRRKEFGAFCINGVYEYTKPVIINGEVACIIFIGNIFIPQKEKDLKKYAQLMENDFSQEQCAKTAQLIESYIRCLLEKFPDSSEKNSVLVQNIKKYIAANITYELSIKQIARIFSYNEIYIGRLFRRETKMTVNEYINKLRIKLACDILDSDSEISVLDAAMKAGFNNVTYFNRIFKKQLGITPSVYKTKHTENADN